MYSQPRQVTENIELHHQTISMYSNLEIFKNKYFNAEISKDTHLEFLENMKLYKLEILSKDNIIRQLENKLSLLEAKKVINLHTSSDILPILHTSKTIVSNL